MSGLAEILLVVGVIPLVWSAGAYALHTRRRAASVGSMRLETAMLGLMLAPILLGAVALILSPTVPGAPLPALGFEDIGWIGAPAGASSSVDVAAAIAPPTAAIDLLTPASLAIVVIYLAGFAWTAARLLSARLKLDRAARRGAAAPQLGEAVRLTDEALPPFASACGAVVLPRALADRMSPEELAFVVRHEQAHLDRGDPCSFLALASVDAVFWFNLFVRRQTARCRLAAELACDAAVVAQAPEHRGDYARVLVAAVKHAAAGPCLAPSIVSTQDAGEHRMRLMRIMTETPAPRSRFARLATIGAALLVVPLGGLQLTACAGGSSAPSARTTAESAPRQAEASDPAIEVLAENGADVAVERIDESLIRLTGPMRVRASAGEYLTRSAEVRLSPDGDPTGSKVLQISVLDAEVIRSLPGQTAAPVQTGETLFTLCAGAIASLPQLGRLEGGGGPCSERSAFATEPERPRTMAENPQEQPWEGVALSAVPVDGRVTNPFGRRVDPITTDEPSYHAGIDLRAAEGTPIVAAADGRVTFAGWRGGYGRVVEMDHGGDVKTRYAQLSAFDVAKDDQIAAGQVIGRSGSSGRATGPHLHFELWYASEVYDPLPVFEALGFEPLTGKRTRAASPP